MKFDRNPRNQSARIEAVKQDRTRTVDRLPDQPSDGETVILRQKDKSKQVCTYSRDGEWICVSAVGEAVDEVPIPAVPAAPIETITFSSTLGDPP
ncbi:hypothetical protein F4X33_19695 [Candidatus Poribacteria bacterium]|nr:hypothetical protein [Candidatus Poribacteria bacterium]